MDNEFEIEIMDEEPGKEAAVQLPLNFLTFGEIENDDVKVYIKQNVYKSLEKLSSSDTSKELGSIILGQYCQELGKTHVIISDYIEAKYTDASAATLTFTHETWDYIHSEHEKSYSDKKIIGWQHTHPNYGIFLSNYDMFIQENFFNLPFQIAYVIDPIQNIRGFFQWKNGKIEKLKGYYVYDEVGKPIKIEQTKIKKDDASSGKASKLSKVLTGLLCAATALLSVFYISLSIKYEKQQEIQQEIINNINNQKEELAHQSNIINELQEQLVNTVLDSSGKTTAAALIEMLEGNRLTIENKDSVLSSLKAFVEGSNNNAEEISFSAYTVAEGDNLYTICLARQLNYEANLKIILAINGIENADELYAGQTILLPVTR